MNPAYAERTALPDIVMDSVNLTTDKGFLLLIVVI
jgi:hypothetical protein